MVVKTRPHPEYAHQHPHATGLDWRTLRGLGPTDSILRGGSGLRPAGNRAPPDTAMNERKSSGEALDDRVIMQHLEATATSVLES